jgi:hypothetical protein
VPFSGTFAIRKIGQWSCRLSVRVRKLRTPGSACLFALVAEVALISFEFWRCNLETLATLSSRPTMGDKLMNSIIYLVGLVVIVIAILSFLGLR